MLELQVSTSNKQASSVRKRKMQNTSTSHRSLLHQQQQTKRLPCSWLCPAQIEQCDSCPATRLGSKQTAQRCFGGISKHSWPVVRCGCVFFRYTRLHWTSNQASWTRIVIQNQVRDKKHIEIPENHRWNKPFFAWVGSTPLVWDTSTILYTSIGRQSIPTSLVTSSCI